MTPMHVSHTSDGSQLQLQGRTLLLAAVTLGNVGQLALDLLVSTLRLSRQVCLSSHNVLPCLGYDAFGPASRLQPDQATHLVTALELYQLGDVALLQQRAPAAKGRQQAYAEELAAWIVSMGFQHVVLLGSLDAAHRLDAQIGSAPAVYTLSEDDGMARQCQQLGLTSLQEAHVADIQKQESLLPPWTLRAALQSARMPLLGLFTFSTDSDSSQDAFRLADAANRLLQLMPEHRQLPWQPPVSWQSVYGPPSLYVY